MPIEQINGTPLFFASDGDGEPLVLVHGSWGEHSNWDPIMPAFSQSHRVVRYDRRGHGLSNAPAVEGTVHDDVADLAALIETLGLAPTNLFGNSFGACVSLRLAATRPELVRRLAVHEPPLVGILADDPDVQPIVAGLQSRIGPVVELLEADRDAEAAERFVETVALGPGMWATLPETQRATFVRNAKTFLGETRDPDALMLDVGSLSAYRGPALLSQGDQSPPMFAPIIDKLGNA